MTTHAAQHFPTLLAKQTALGAHAQAVLDNAQCSGVLAMFEEIEEQMGPFSATAMPIEWVLSKAEDAKWRITSFTEALIDMSLALAAWRVEMEAIVLDPNDIDACQAWVDA
ncbi:hypothetical protein [Burkholderia ubonensis]|uniref:hypothetical protein n=1 Tax=Burkholderia ubonensis TaxID=101571 RepID=UPI0002E2F95C|nr:hypothetical protein [Burkholderia ubonensis]